MRKNVNYLKEFFKYIKSRYIIFGLIFLFSLVLASFSLVYPFVFGNALVSLISFDYSSFIKYIVIFIVLELSEKIINVINNIFYNMFTTKITMDLKLDLYNKVMDLEYSSFDKMKTGNFADRILESPYHLVNYGFKLMYMIISAIKIVSLILISYKLCLDIGVIFTVASVIIYITLANTNPYIDKVAKRSKKAFRLHQNTLYKNLRNIREIKNWGIKDRILDDFKNSEKELRNISKDAKTQESLVNLLMFTIKFSMHSLVLIIASYYFYKNQLSFVHFIVLESYAISLYNLMKLFAETNDIISFFKLHIKNVFDIFTNKMFSDEVYGTMERQNIEGSISFRNVSYRYSSGKYLIKNLDFDITKKNIVAINDKSGYGAIAAAELLLKHYKPTKGEILIDGVNINEYGRMTYKRLVSSISESPLIIDGTLIDNLRLVKPDISTADIISVSEKSYLLEAFKEYEDFYNIKLGKDGVPLSEVKKQQIAIARTMLINPKIVIFNEINMDMTTDEMYYLKKGLEQISKDATLILLSDKLTSILDCDEIITLDNGVLSGISRRGDIMRERHLYSRIAELDLEMRDAENRKAEKKEEENDALGQIGLIMDEIIKPNTEVPKKGENNEHRIFSQIW